MIYEGSCHCSAVKFEVEAPESVECQECNCSICRMTGYLHLIVRADDFSLLAGREELVTYSFNTDTARHMFCRTCGIKSFYVPRSNPDGYSVNVRCLSPQPKQLKIMPFDGVNWEAGAAALAHLSK